MNYFTDIDLNGNELKNATIEKLDKEPSNPQEGQIYYDTKTHTIRYYNGIKWSSGGGGVASYNDLLDLPTLEGEVILGDMTLDRIGLIPITFEEIDEMFK